MRFAIPGVGLLLLSVAACRKQEPSSTIGEALANERPLTSSLAPPPGPNVDAMKFPVLGAVPIPSENPSSEAKVKLGHQLFFDKRLSVDGSRSCYSCHLNEDGTGGHEPVAIGAKGKALTRHSPVLWNVGYLPRLYHDGRSNSLEDQALAAWSGGNMGVGKENLEAKAQQIARLAGYRKQFAAVFPGKDPTPELVVQAISAFERSLICNDTAYDKYAKGNHNALSAAQKEGLELFMGKAGCVACHAPPHFSTAYLSKDGTYFNTGIGTVNKKEEEVDVGRQAVTKSDADWAAFKPPTLRNVHKSAPYFHDGSEYTLEDAVRLMARGGHSNKAKSPLLIDRKLTSTEIARLVTFLEALNCPGAIPQPTVP